jgi:uncharacterized protein
MRILIVGGSGMIGTALARSLLTDGHGVWVLTRHPETAHVPDGVKRISWDGKTTTGWGDIVGQVDGVVNLVGERLSKWPWTREQKQRFWDSRLFGGQALVDAIRASPKKPSVLIQASGSNYYGPHGDSRISETQPAGSDFLAELCKAWEQSTQPVEMLGVRRVIVRSAIVLSTRDGILPIMMFPVKLFMGGPLGSGLQGVPWIHLDDEVASIRFLLENQNSSGAFNLTSPNPISNAEFFRILARKLKRPFWLPVPKVALKLVLGGMSALVLDGAYLLPGRLQELGFEFRFKTLESALDALLAD